MIRILASLFVVALAVRIDCSLVYRAVSSLPVLPEARKLTIALRELRDTKGAPKPMTLEEFRAQARELAMFLAGQREATAMATNRFFSKTKQKIEIEDALRGPYDEDKSLIQDSLHNEISAALRDLRYGEKTSADILAELSKAKEVSIFTHQIPELQKSNTPVVWLVGAESSAPLSPAAAEAARLIEHSVGGDFGFSLAAAETVNVGGGVIDQCLAQTIASVARNTRAKQVKVRVLMSQTYADLVDRKHASLSEVMRAPIENRKEFRQRTRRELTLMMREVGFRPGSEPAVQPEEGAFLAPLVFTHRSGREVRLEFAP